MTLSIIVPVFNMALDGKLAFCLDSLVNQTVTDYEIIAVNDASTDNSLEILRAYESKYPALIKVVTYPDNRHQGGARNEGLKHACGEWISFIDSDDWVCPEYFEKLLNKAYEKGADVVGTSYSVVFKHTYEVGQINKTDLPKYTGITDTEKHKLLLMNSGSMVMKIYRRELIEENNLSFPEHMFYEDNAMAPVWSLYFKHFEFVDEPMYYYYQHENSTVHTVTEERSRDRLKAIEILISEMQKRGFYEGYKEELEAVFIRTYIVNTLFGYMIACKDRKLSFVREIKAGIFKYFPDFRKNKYYDSIPDAEQKKMLDLFMKNTLTFYVYYGALWKYRRFKNRKSS